MHPKDADGMANLVDLEQTTPEEQSVVYTVSPDLSLQTRRRIMVR